jgi:hypothetical protein
MLNEVGNDVVLALKRAWHFSPRIEFVVAHFSLF